MSMPSTITNVGPAMSILDHNNISIITLAEVLTNAAIRCTTVDEEDNSLYLEDGVAFPIWLFINQKRKTIQFYTYVVAKEDASMQMLKEFVHEKNDTLMTVRFMADETETGSLRLCADYTIYTAFGLLVSQLIHTAREFSDIFIKAVRSDEDDILF